uniref:Glycoprotein H n=1 Tax=Equid gammaherpesvirus 2 TaxID=12657 RepID=F2WU50_9GAMA|nr:glycoprotein H [Equid gammaherpesvirus 2]
MMRYSLLCTCLFLAWWAIGGRGLATPSPSTPGMLGSTGSHATSGSPGTRASVSATTRKILPTAKSVNYTEMIEKNPSLTIDLGNQTKYQLNWTDVVKVIPGELIEKMWEESNVTESLWFTLNKFTDVYKKDTIFKNFTGHFTTNYVCNVSQGEPNYNVSQREVKEIKEYDGNFGIPAPVVLSDLLASVNYVLRPQHATHTVFYTTRDYDAYFSVFFGDKDTQMLGYITRDFSFVTAVSWTNGTFRFLTTMMGYTDRLPVLKGHLIYKTDFIVGQNERFSMVILTTFLDHAYFESLVHPDFQGIFKDLTERPPVEVIVELQDKMVELEATQKCPVQSMSKITFEYVLKFAFSHFMAVAGLEDAGQHVKVRCLFDVLHELALLRAMTATCFHPFYFKGFTSNHLSSVATVMVTRTPIKQLKTFSHGDRDAVLATLQVADNVKEATDRILWAAAEIMDDIYTTYTDSFYLKLEDRGHLLDVFVLLRDKEKQHQVLKNRNLMIIYLTAGSMCNSVEISTVTSMLSDKNHYSLRRTFSPCLMSLRFDFTKDKLISETRLLPNMTYLRAEDGATGFFNILRDRHVATFNLLPVSSCLKDYAKNILMVIPMFNLTYVVSTAPISIGINYDVRDTFIEKKMFVSAVMSNCSKFPEGSGTRQIPIVYNITRSRSECPLCGAAFLAYDERDGLESMMYVTNRRVERNIFSDASPFFDNQNLHTHYLMLFKNGTVIEIRGRYRERTAQFIIITLFILTLMFGAFLAFKIFVYCC